MAKAPKQIKHIARELNNSISDKIPNINSGGCGVFASLIYPKLKEMGYNSPEEGK